MTGGASGRRAFLGWLGLALVLVAFFAEPLFTDRVLFYRDAGTAVHPVLEEARRDGAGELVVLPTWTPRLSHGRPLLANPGHSLLSPLSVVYLVLPFDDAFDAFLVLHVVLAGILMMALARWLGLSIAAGFAAGVGFALGGWIVSATNLHPTLAAGAWAPAVLWAGLAATARPSPRRVAWLSVAVSLQVLGGQPEPVLLTVMTGVVWSVVAVAGGSWIARLWRTAAVFGVAGVGAALLSAPQLLPALLLSRRTLRSLGFTPEALLYNSLDPHFLPGLALPRWGGHPIERVTGGFPGRAWTDTGTPYQLSVYCGLSVVALALVGLVATWRRRARGLSAECPVALPRLATVAAATAVAGVVLALGRHVPGVEAVVDAVPWAIPFRYPVKALLLTALATPLLAALGVSAVQRWRGAGAAGRLAATLAAVVVAGDLSLAHRGFAPTIDGAALDAPPLAAALADAAARLGVGEGQWRLHHQRPPWTGLAPPGERSEQALHRWARRALAPPTGAPHGISHAFEPSDDMLVFLPYFRLTVALHEAEPHAWAAGLGEAGTLWVIALRGDLEHRTRGVLRRVRALGEQDGLPPGSGHLYRNAAFLPRARLTRSVREVAGGGTIPDVVARHGVSTWPPVVLAELAPPAGAAAGAAGLATIVDDAAERLTVATESPADSVLVVSDVHAPGWSATLDGEPVAIARANHAFRAVAVPAGQHVVSFRYRPPGFRAGVLASAVALLAVLIALFLGAGRAARSASA